MAKDIEKLLAAVAAGGDEAREAAATLRRIVGRGGAQSEAVLLALLGSDSTAVRLLGVQSAREQRGVAAVLEALLGCARDPEAEVRRELAAALGGAEDERAREALAALLEDEDFSVRTAAVAAAVGEAWFLERLLARLRADAWWQVREAAARAVAGLDAEVVAPELLRRFAIDEDDDVRAACAASLDGLIERAGGPPRSVAEPDVELAGKAWARLGDLPPLAWPRLRAWLEAAATTRANPAELARFGRDLTAEAEAGRLPRGHGLAELLERVERLLFGQPPRSVVLLGPSGAGKTALVNALAWRLRDAPAGAARWRLVRVAPNDLLVGTKYLGEWETRLDALIKAAGAARRVLLYVPGIEGLSDIGRSSSSDNNAALALAPHIEEGRVVVIGESTPEAWARRMGGDPRFRRLLEPVQLEEASAERTLEVLRAVRDELAVPLDEDGVAQVAELTEQYLRATVRPGAAVDFLRQIAASWGEREDAPGQRDLLEALSTSTGIPTDLLDDARPLDLRAVREFFDARVMGQPEAVEAVLDLVTLIKAGLTDPLKPMGVLLFVGPTGVGKTELARALAEHIFGDPARLLRFDMSEFASYDGYQRLIGADGGPGQLTEAVRRQPFSVVLFDEIEKGHTNVFDLCLQLFDAGRLTDGLGRTVDFRRTVLVLTSNVGAGAPGDGGRVGFGAADAPAEDASGRTLRELQRVFRPEFLGRIDRIISFRPLSLQVAEGIARREVRRVLGRSGIARRELAVDVSPEVLAFLVKEGYSPHFGARPLKRAVERLVLLPVARAIAAGQLEAGTVLRLVQRGSRVEVEAAAPDEASEVERAPATELRDLGAMRERADALLARAEALVEAENALGRRKAELLERTRQEGFWSVPDHAREIFDEVRRIDELLATQRGLREALRNLRHRLAARGRDELGLAETRHRLDGLAAEVEQSELIARCRDMRDLGDALLALSLVDRRAEGGVESGVNGVALLARMYLGLARRRHFDGDVLGELRESGSEERAYLRVSGLGAYKLLRGESGLHHLSLREPAPRSGRDRRREARDVVRVDVLPVAQANDSGTSNTDAITVQVQPRRDDGPGLVLERAELRLAFFDPRSAVALTACAAGPRQEAVSRLEPLVRALRAAAALGESPGGPPVVRRYELGAGQRVRDLRTGLVSSRLDRVLQGHLDAFLRVGDEG